MLQVETPRDDVDVGLHHHRAESLVDSVAGLEDRGEERPGRQLGIASCTPPALVVNNRGRCPLRRVVTLGVARPSV